MLNNLVLRGPAGLAAAATLAFVTSPLAAEAQGNYGYMNHPMMGVGWFFGPLMMVLFIALIVVVVILAVRWFDRDRDSLQRSDRRSGHADPLDTLKDRLARGEIDVAEYEERKRALGG